MGEERAVKSIFDGEFTEISRAEPTLPVIFNVSNPFKCPLAELVVSDNWHAHDVKSTRMLPFSTTLHIRH